MASFFEEAADSEVTSLSALLLLDGGRLSVVLTLIAVTNSATGLPPAHYKINSIIHFPFAQKVQAIVELVSIDETSFRRPIRSSSIGCRIPSRR